MRVFGHYDRNKHADLLDHLHHDGQEATHVTIISTGFESVALAALEASKTVQHLLLLENTNFATAFKPYFLQVENLESPRSHLLALRKQLSTKTQQYLEEHDLFTLNIVGRSSPIQTVKRLIRKFASLQAPVLILGETGTGKELVARALHYGSIRRDEPFMAINCAAFTDELLLSELFGHEKGAFTDAKKKHTGIVEEAAGGSLFLDEFDSLSVRAQAILLRFIQEKEYRPIGGTEVANADVRIICASNKDLSQLSHAGLFREDLLYRVNVFQIVVPPLRERYEDIHLICDHLLNNLSRQYNSEDKYLSEQTLQWMQQYNWPGNIRELENYLHRVFVLSNRREILARECLGDPDDFDIEPVYHETPRPPGRASRKSFRESKQEAILAFERSYLTEVMAEAKGNISAAARISSSERRAFTRLLQKHNIHRAQFSEAD